jgi:hypothetical protein
MNRLSKGYSNGGYERSAISAKDWNQVGVPRQYKVLLAIFGALLSGKWGSFLSLYPVSTLSYFLPLIKNKTSQVWAMGQSGKAYVMLFIALGG